MSWNDHIGRSAGGNSVAGEVLRVALVGDVSLNGRYQALLDGGGEALLEALKAVLPAGVPVVANLEAPLTAAHPIFPGKASLRADPRWAAILRRAGVAAVSLGNNHTMDSGLGGLDETRAALADQGIAFAGAGRDLEQARRPALFESGGRRVALLSYCQVIVRSPVWASATEPGLAAAREEWILEDIAALQGTADEILVAMHWGEESRRLPMPGQRELARRILAAGASAVVGHHSHTLQGCERFDSKPVLYSLGNFLFSPFDWSGVNDANERFESHIRFGTEGDFGAIAVLGRNRPESDLSLEWIGARLDEKLLPRSSARATKRIAARSRALHAGYPLREKIDGRRSAAEIHWRDVGPIRLGRLLRLRPRHFGQLWRAVFGSGRG